MNEKLSLLTDNQKDFLNFLKSRYSLFHLSNVFFRDLHYGVMAYFDLKGVRHQYSEAENVTRRLVDLWQTQELLRKIDERAFMLNYPDFKKPSTKPAAPAKPAAKPAVQTASKATPASSAPAAKPAAAAAPAKPTADGEGKPVPAKPADAAPSEANSPTEQKPEKPKETPKG